MDLSPDQMWGLWQVTQLLWSSISSFVKWCEWELPLFITMKVTHNQKQSSFLYLPQQVICTRCSINTHWIKWMICESDLKLCVLGRMQGSGFLRLWYSYYMYSLSFYSVFELLASNLLIFSSSSNDARVGEHHERKCVLQLWIAYLHHLYIWRILQSLSYLL